MSLGEFKLLDIAQRKCLKLICFSLMGISSAIGRYYFEIKDGPDWSGIDSCIISFVVWGFVSIIIVRGTE